jgi:hypothetical protein
MEEIRMKYSDLDLGTIEATFNMLGGIEGAARLRRGELILVPKPKPPSDYIVRVDRSVKPTYPFWTKEGNGVIHSELELVGLSEYDLQKDVQEWIHDGQKTGSVSGQVIYLHLKKKNKLVRQFGLVDLLALQAKGVGVFRDLYEDKKVFGWKSVIASHEGDLRVPCLCQNGDKFEISWYRLSSDFSDNDIGLCFIKSEPQSDPVLDFTIHVDRSVRPICIDWMKENEVVFPELEFTGPPEYNLQTGVQEWIHEAQKTRTMAGGLICQYLEANNKLVRQFGLADLLALQAKGTAVFRKLYAGKKVCGWKSVTKSHNGNNSSVPFLYEDGNEIMLGWRWLGGDFDSNYVSPRFNIPEPVSEPVLDFMVHVDRSVKPIYPEWFKKLEQPELELAGPAEYDLNTVSQWLHDDQKTGVVSGNTIYDQLKKDNALASCLNLQDGLAIQQKGVAVFRKLYAGKAVFLWGSVVKNDIGRFEVPSLSESGDGVVVRWNWLGNSWISCHPALRFSK